MAEVIKYHSRPIKQAFCMTCEWKLVGPNAQAVAYNHAKHQGHEVAVDVILTFVYDATGRKEEEVSSEK